MERVIEVTWYTTEGFPQLGDAIVEYARYNEEGKCVKEALNVFLPEGVPTYQHAEVKKQVTELFHNGEGYDF